MKCGECRNCVVEKVFMDELPDGKDYMRVEIQIWNEGDTEKPFCLMQDLYTNVDPNENCCDEDTIRFAGKKKEKSNE